MLYPVFYWNLVPVVSEAKTSYSYENNIQAQINSFISKEFLTVSVQNDNDHYLDHFVIAERYQSIIQS
jgi:hypothetical protein